MERFAQFVSQLLLSALTEVMPDTTTTTATVYVYVTVCVCACVQVCTKCDNICVHLMHRGNVCDKGEHRPTATTANANAV